MSRTRFTSIGLMLSVVLAGAGCGRSRALSVPNGPVLGTGEGPTAVADSRDGAADAITGMTLEAGAAPLLLDASAALDVAGAEPDAGTDAAPSLPANHYRAIAISVGRLNNCALLDDHRVKCWGENGYGQLGLGDRMNRGPDPAGMGDNLPTVDLGTGRTAKSVTAGFQGSCAILDNDDLKCWGGRAAPNGTSNIGDQPGEMGDHLQPIDVGVGRKAVAAVNALDQTCAALDDGSFLCWGGPSVSIAAAADGAMVVQFVRDMSAVGVFDDGSVRLVSLFSPSGPTPLDFGGRLATLVAANDGFQYVGECAILRTGGTACLGAQFYPIVPTDASVVAIAITEYGHACGLDSAGVVTCWNLEFHPAWIDATNPSGTTSHVPLGQPATAIGAGDYNACALLADGTVKCWAIDGTYAPSLGGSVATATGVSAVDLGTRPAP